MFLKEIWKKKKNKGLWSRNNQNIGAETNKINRKFGRWSWDSFPENEVWRLGEKSQKLKDQGHAEISKDENHEVRERNFPGVQVVKNTPSNAGDLGSIPGQGTKIPHAVGQLSLHIATNEVHN